MRPGSFVVTTDTALDTRRIGVAVGRVLRAGDLLILRGGLAAGKTTLAQGIAEGLGVRGPITSPTFVIARTHPSLRSDGGPAMVHVDAYRLGGVEELDDIDLDTGLASAVTVVEWGSGMADQLSTDRLLIELEPIAVEGPTLDRGERAVEPRAVDVSEVIQEPRRIGFIGVGERWDNAAFVDLRGDLARAIGDDAAGELIP